MLSGAVIMMRGYNPVEILAQIKRRRVSVLVSVPKVLDVLREHVLRVAPYPDLFDGAGRLKPSGQHFLRRWWRTRPARTPCRA